MLVAYQYLFNNNLLYNTNTSETPIMNINQMWLLKYSKDSLNQLLSFDCDRYFIPTYR